MFGLNQHRCGGAVMSCLVASILVLLCGELWAEPSIDVDARGGWIAQQSGTSANLTGVAFVGEKQGWVVGEGGVVMQTWDGGMHWVSQTLETGVNLMAVDFVDPKHGWVVGDNMTILATADGGKSWVAQTGHGHGAVWDRLRRPTSRMGCGHVQPCIAIKRWWVDMDQA